MVEKKMMKKENGEKNNSEKIVKNGEYFIGKFWQ